MKIGISGGSGLIGRTLSERLQRQGHHVTVFGRTRVEGRTFVEWDMLGGPPSVESLTGLDGLVHLAGEPIASGRWTDERKRLIRDSRVQGTRNLVRSLRDSPRPPRILVSASAVGFYGDRGHEELVENSASGSGFLPEVCREWESEALAAKQSGIRVVLLRTGIVLSLDGGVLEKMLTPFRLGMGGKLGNGRQYMSWIHILDHIRLVEEILSDDRFDGPVNATAPTPVTNKEFTEALAKSLHRPSWFSVPGPALRLAMGEMAETLLLEGQRVIPQKALDLSFQFRFPELKKALQDLLGS